MAEFFGALLGSFVGCALYFGVYVKLTEKGISVNPFIKKTITKQKAIFVNPISQTEQFEKAEGLKDLLANEET